MSATTRQQTEHRVEDESGFLLNRETGDVTPWEGVRIRWRFVGERAWHKCVLIPDATQGQTRASLRRDAGKIVTVLAGKVTA